MNLLCNLQTGIMDDGVQLNLLALWMALFVIFAGRKFTQPIKVPSCVFFPNHYIDATDLVGIS